MSRPRTGPLLLSAAILAAGLALVWQWQARRARGLADVVRLGAGPSAIVAAPLAGGAGWPDDAERPSVLDALDARWPASAFRRVALSPATVREIVRLADVGSLFDPWAAHRALPWLDVEVSWREHPRGAWRQATDALGLRRDREPATRAPDLRVLFTGDSHTDGVCDNADSFCGLLEAQLAERHPGRTVEVLNAARSSSSFVNYLGVLERWLALEPDVFVAVVYGGNDFVEALEWQRLVQGLPQPEPTADERARVEAALKRHPPAIAQAFHALDVFARRPEDRELALQAARDVTTEIQAVCARFGVRFVLAYLPPATDVEWPRHADGLDAVRGILELDADDLANTDRMADSLLAFARARGIESVDLRARLRAAEVPVYWSGDLHLDLEGHREVARALLPILEPELAERRARARQSPRTLRPALPQWGPLLAPGAPGPADWARWARGTGPRTPAGSSADPAVRRVLVLGDEQVTAPRSDARRLPALLAAAWQRLHPARAIDVRDGATAGHGFEARRAELERHGARRDETVVLVVDADTDFLQVLQRRPSTELESDLDVAELTASHGDGSLVLRRMALASLACFGRDPGQAERAHELALATTLGLDAAARAAGARLAVVYLPPALEIDAFELAAVGRAACSVLGLAPAAQGILSRLGRRYVSDAQARGIDVFDVGQCVPPHIGRLIDRTTGCAAIALQEQMAEVLARLLDAE